MSARFLIYLIILFLVFLTGAFSFKKLSNSYRLLTVFILITFISESCTRYFALKYGNSSPVYPIYLSLQFFFITTFYSFYIVQSRTIIAWSWVIFALMVLLNTIFFQDVWKFASNMVLISSLVYVCCSLFLFKQMLSNVVEKSILKQELFWYNTSSLILYIFTFFCWSFFNILLKSDKIGTLYTIIYYLVIQNYIITGVAIFLNGRSSSTNK